MMAPWFMKLELYITKNVQETKLSLNRCRIGGSWTSMMWFANCQHQRRKKILQIACCTHSSCHNFNALYVCVKISQGVEFLYFAFNRTLQNLTWTRFWYVKYCCGVLLRDIMDSDMICFVNSMVLFFQIMCYIIFKLWKYFTKCNWKNFGYVKYCWHVDGYSRITHDMLC